MSVLLRPAGFADEAFLRALYATTRAGELAAAVDWTEAERDRFLDFQFRAQASDYQSRFPRATHDIVVVDGVSVGRIWVDRGLLEARLIDLALLPEHQGRGIGTGLVRDLQRDAARRGVPLRHMVVKENLGAIRFYGRLGFRTTGEIMSHLQMEWRRPAVPA